MATAIRPASDKLIAQLIAQYGCGPVKFSGTGDALYIPPYAFHWAEGSSDVTVTLSCAFSTPETERTELVHACNVRLRRLRLPAGPPGRSRHRDRAKAALMSRARRLRRKVSPRSG